MALSVRQVLDIVSIILATLFLVAKVVINGVVGNGIGVKNDTGEISDQFETEVRPIAIASLKSNDPFSDSFNIMV